MQNTTLMTLAAAGLVLIAAGMPQESELSKSIARGKVTYEELCITCHLADGKGMEGAFPPLANSDYLKSDLEGSIRAVKFGQEGELKVNGEVYNNIMPAPGIADQEVTDVMNYILNSWGNKGKEVTLSQVEAVAQ